MQTFKRLDGNFREEDNDSQTLSRWQLLYSSKEFTEHSEICDKENIDEWLHSMHNRAHDNSYKDTTSDGDTLDSGYIASDKNNNHLPSTSLQDVFQCIDSSFKCNDSIVLKEPEKRMIQMKDEVNIDGTHSCDISTPVNGMRQAQTFHDCANFVFSQSPGIIRRTQTKENITREI